MQYLIISLGLSLGLLLSLTTLYHLVTKLVPDENANGAIAVEAEGDDTYEMITETVGNTSVRSNTFGNRSANPYTHFESVMKARGLIKKTPPKCKIGTSLLFLDITQLDDQNNGSDSE
jgi:hypothetical protein